MIDCVSVCLWFCFHIERWESHRKRYNVPLCIFGYSPICIVSLVLFSYWRCLIRDVTVIECGPLCVCLCLQMEGLTVMFQSAMFTMFSKTCYFLDFDMFESLLCLSLWLCFVWVYDVVIVVFEFIMLIW